MPNAFNGLGSSGPYVPNYLQDEIQFRIDSDLRTIAIPADGVVLGVVGDKNVNHVNFQMPAWYNGFDMSTFQARINFIDASGNVNYYTVDDMTVMTPEGTTVIGTPGENDIIYFTWLVDSYATGYVGQVRFNVRLTKFDTSGDTPVLSQAFNTQVNTCQVLEGIQLADEITQEQAEDILFHMTAEMQDVTDKLIQDIEAKGAETLESIPDDYDELGAGIVSLNKDLIKYRYDMLATSNVVDGKYVNGYGQEASADGWSYLSRAKIDNINLPIHIENGLWASTFYCFYDKNNTFISGNAITDVEDNSYIIPQYHIPANASYITISFGTERKDNLKIYQAYDYEYIKDNLFETFTKTVTNDASYLLTNANLAEDGKIYRLQISGALPQNMPANYPSDSTLYWLITITNTHSWNTIKMQYIFDINFFVKWKRELLTNGTWTSWQAGSRIEDAIENSMVQHPNLLYVSASSELPDCDDAESGKLYRMQILSGYPDNLPDNYPTDVTTHYLYTIMSKRTDNNSYNGVQYIFGYNFNVEWTRTYWDDAWHEWSEVESGSDSVIECGAGKKYTTLRSAIAKGTELGCKVIVHAGTYDLCTEFADVLSSHTGTGCVLGNGVEVVFMPGAKVVANVPTTNTWSYTNFEPFVSSGNGSFTLDNLHIETSNTRYCVHDEHNGSGTYKHIYRNCVMKNTAPTGLSTFPQCIGGGLGEHGYIEIVGGVYDCDISDESLQLPITYHNGISSTCESRIVVRDVYLKNKGRLRFTHYGTSTKMTDVNVSGCSMGQSILVTAETAQSTTENVSLVEWNNTVRTD